MGEYNLGSVAIVPVAPELCVANLIGQSGIGNHGHIPPIRYEAIRKGFQRIIKYETERGRDGEGPENTSIHMPRLGCGLAGGDWALIEPLIEATFIEAGMDVTVYDFPGGVPYFDSRNEGSEQFVREGSERVMAEVVCDGCEDTFSEDETTGTECGVDLCDSCYETHMQDCKVCDEVEDG